MNGTGRFPARFSRGARRVQRRNSSADTARKTAKYTNTGARPNADAIAPLASWWKAVPQKNMRFSAASALPALSLAVADWPIAKSSGWVDMPQPKTKNTQASK